MLEFLIQLNGGNAYINLINILWYINDSSGSSCQKQFCFEGNLSPSLSSLLLDDFKLSMLNCLWSVHKKLCVRLFNVPLNCLETVITGCGKQICTHIVCNIPLLLKVSSLASSGQKNTPSLFVSRTTFSGPSSVSEKDHCQGPHAKQLPQLSSPITDNDPAGLLGYSSFTCVMDNMLAILPVWS